MAISKKLFVDYLKEADFRSLFIEEMGWNKYSASLADIPSIIIDEKEYHIKTIAHRNGFQVLQCNVRDLPSNSTCKKLDTKLRKAANDYICIFVIQGTEHHQWVAPVKTNEKRDIVIIEYTEAEKAQFLYEKISGLSFNIDEVTTIVDVKERVQEAFAINSEKITKDFYTGFNKEHKAFAEFISGIDDEIATKDNKNKQWYTSVMLNRLMFCYFIQKKGFLNGDEHYLRNKLRWVQEQRGKDQFFKSFYKGFLVHLFRDGLNTPKHESSFENVYGRIPYLNGGMFDLHQIEKDYANIDIRDEAFVSLFEFFDKWRWHLDTRVTASGRDINPDVLGYIFEQYINDRAQMGAYYTKEDITEYIGRNTIIPYLLEATRKQYSEAFAPNAPFWSFIRSHGQDFIYDAVKKGVHETIPEDIAKGLDTEAPNLIERRKSWNNLTPSNIGLPTEIWRETIERLQHYSEIVDKLQGGDFNSFDDFITYNLNIPKIAYDFLNSTDDKKFIEVFYDELRKVTILDPTCGSGAFLFAALNLLEPLYEVCISRMEEFYAQDHHLFKEQLAEIQNKYRSNIQYFIYKSIILRNLYGVDIMAEAVEIAKLRLFLKMVAVVEVDKRADNMGLDPLPDIDFNIRCGNTLVGYATEEHLYHDLANASDFLQQLANQELKEKLQKQLKDVADTYEIFRTEQLSKDADVSLLKQAKVSLNDELAKLNKLLNKHLYSSTAQIDYSKWLESHQPFHWIAEFYQIICGNKGFDIVIGNPPYVVYGSALQKAYKVTGFESYDCKNLYGYVVERSNKISHQNSRIGFIIPISSVASPAFEYQQRLYKSNSTWISNYAATSDPGVLFIGVKLQLSIFIMSKDSNRDNTYTTGYRKWYKDERQLLFSNIAYGKHIQVKDYAITKVHNTRLEHSILRKVDSQNDSILRGKNLGNSPIYFKKYGNYFWKMFLDFIPFFDDGEKTQSGSIDCVTVRPDLRYEILSVLNSTLFYYVYMLTSDCRNLTKSCIEYFKYVGGDPVTSKALASKGVALEKDVKSRTVMREERLKSGAIRKVEIFSRYSESKPLIDDIDQVLARYYGLTEEELDFIINFDIKYRMGDNLNADDSEE